MYTEKTLVTLALTGLCALGCLSSLFPIVNTIMTVLVIGAAVIGGIAIARKLIHLNRETTSQCIRRLQYDDVGGEQHECQAC